MCRVSSSQYSSSVFTVTRLRLVCACTNDARMLYLAHKDSFSPLDTQYTIIVFNCRKFLIQKNPMLYSELVSWSTIFIKNFIFLKYKKHSILKNLRFHHIWLAVYSVFLFGYFTVCIIDRHSSKILLGLPWLWFTQGVSERVDNFVRVCTK